MPLSNDDPFAGDTLPPELALDDEAPWDDDPPETYDDEKAEWSMRTIVRSQLAVLKAAQQRDAWIARIDRWYEEVTATDVERIARRTETLERYAVMVRERDGRKTVKLPSGTIETRRDTEAHVDIVDEKALYVWATDALDLAELDLLYRTERTPRVTALREYWARIVTTEDGDRLVVDEDGALIPGVAIVDPVTVPSVKPRHE